MDVIIGHKVKLVRIRDGDTPKDVLDGIPLDGIHVHKKTVYARYIDY
jgi:hypothetical protein